MDGAVLIFGPAGGVALTDGLRFDNPAATRRWLGGDHHRFDWSRVSGALAETPHTNQNCGWLNRVTKFIRSSDERDVSPPAVPISYR